MRDEMQNRVLVLGFGNPGRADDGLGPALVDLLTASAIPGVSLESNYQLTIEDTDTVARHAVTVFVDADVQVRAPFHFSRVVAADELGISSHDVEPAAVVALAETLFGACGKSYLLRIRGYSFAPFTHMLSRRAAANLCAATRFIEDVIRSGSFEHVVTQDKAQE